MRLYEGQSTFDIVFGLLGAGNTSATSGVQKNDDVLHPVLLQRQRRREHRLGHLYPAAVRTTGTPVTATTTRTSTATPVRTATPTATSGTPASHRDGDGDAHGDPHRRRRQRHADRDRHAGGPTATATACTITFSDVDPTNPFYPYIRCLACRGIVRGYGDGTFRWGTDVTRGQLAKIIANAAGLHRRHPDHAADVRGCADQQRRSGCSSSGWPRTGRSAATPAAGRASRAMPPGNRPYFRWTANATRGQIAKIDAIAAGYHRRRSRRRSRRSRMCRRSNPFWLWIEQLAGRGIISGYTCGGPGEPCVPPGNRPYFRWGANATRGQMAKIAAQTFFPNCQTPAR